MYVSTSNFQHIVILQCVILTRSTYDLSYLNNLRMLILIIGSGAH
jgi:hypothetical protein